MSTSKRQISAGAAAGMALRADFGTWPLAPASMQVRIVSRSSSADTTTTGTVGWQLRNVSSALRPSTPGIFKSTSTRPKASSRTSHASASAALPVRSTLASVKISWGNRPRPARSHRRRPTPPRYDMPAWSGCTFPLSGHAFAGLHSIGTCKAAIDPLIEIDQRAFDESNVAQNLPTFKLSDYFEIEYSPNIAKFLVPSPVSAPAVIGPLVAGLLAATRVRRRRVADR